MTTNDDIFLAIGELKSDVRSLVAAKLEDSSRHEKLANRVSTLENRQHWYSGVAAAVSAFSTWAVTGKFGGHG